MISLFKKHPWQIFASLWYLGWLIVVLLSPEDPVTRGTHGIAFVTLTLGWTSFDATVALIQIAPIILFILFILVVRRFLKRKYGVGHSISDIHH